MSPSYRTRLRIARLLTGLLGATLATAAPSLATAQARSSAHVAPPPAPDDREPELLVKVGIGGVGPLEASDLCPGASQCVLGGGGTFNLEFERRWPIGVGIVLGYDAWFVDSGGVFELGVFQALRAAVRYVIAPENAIHPVLHLGGGAILFGETILVSTIGGAIDLGAGAEIEMTGEVALDVGVRGWIFSTSPFTTGRDGTLRADGLGFDGAIQVELGLRFLASGTGR